MKRKQQFQNAVTVKKKKRTNSKQTNKKPQQLNPMNLRNREKEISTKPELKLW